MKLSRRAALKVTVLSLIAFIIFLIAPFRFRTMPHYQKGSKDNDMKKKASPKKTNNQRVAVQPCPGYESETVYRSLKECLRAIGFSFKNGMSVLLKPNIIAQNTPDQATTTHPAIIEALCRILTEKSCAISIGDSSAFYQGGGTAEGFITTGIAEVAERYHARLVPFETTMLRKIRGGAALDPLYVTEEVFQHDLVINLPKLKVHRLARYTGAIKNIYGCVAGGTKQLYHTWFNDRPDYKEYWGVPLVDVYQAIQPGLTIMDAVIGLDKDGPAANGEPRLTGLILASENGPALDVVMCRIMGFDPLWVPAVREAVKRALTLPDKINVIGETPLIPYVKLPDDPPKQGLAKKLDQYVFTQFMVEPRFINSKCTRCDECIQKCAVHAISYNSKKYPVIDFSTCIRCYCCESYCPHGAVSLHGSALNLIMRAVRSVIRL